MKDNSFIMLWNLYLQSCTFTFNVEHLILFHSSFVPFLLGDLKLEFKCLVLNILLSKSLIKGSHIQSEINHSDSPRAETKCDELNGLHKYSLHTLTCYMGVVEEHIKLHTNTNPQPLFHVTFPACTIRELQVPEAVFAPFRRCLK